VHVHYCALLLSEVLTESCSLTRGGWGGSRWARRTVCPSHPPVHNVQRIWSGVGGRGGHSRPHPLPPALLSVSYHSLPMLTFFFLLLLCCKRLRWSRGSVLAFGTPVRAFAPGRSRRNFRVKKSSARLPSEGK